MGAFKSKQKYLRGFTLIEMLIVIAIIAVLAAVAIPSYQKYVERAKRADGKSYILDLASRQERFFSQYLSYTDVIVCAGGGIACGLGLADNSSVENNYTAGITLGPGGCAPGGVSCRTYTITVTPNFIDTDCNQLTYTNTGVEGENGTQDAFYCWR